MSFLWRSLLWRAHERGDPRPDVPVLWPGLLWTQDPKVPVVEEVPDHHSDGETPLGGVACEPGVRVPIYTLLIPLRSSSMSPSATRPCPSTSTATSPTGCTTPSSATPSPSSSSSATSTTRPTVASSPGATPLPPKRPRPSPTEPSTDSAGMPTERRWWGAKMRNPRRTLGGESGKDGPKGIRRQGEVEVMEGGSSSEGLDPMVFKRLI